MRRRRDEPLEANKGPAPRTPDYKREPFARHSGKRALNQPQRNRKVSVNNPKAISKKPLWLAVAGCRLTVAGAGCRCWLPVAAAGYRLPVPFAGAGCRLPIVKKNVLWPLEMHPQKNPEEIESFPHQSRTQSELR